eukprot:scaffold259618_cov17-Tisochrysis_lutea.AAC.1
MCETSRRTGSNNVETVMMKQQPAGTQFFAQGMTTCKEHARTPTPKNVDPNHDEVEPEHICM